MSVWMEIPKLFPNSGGYLYMLERKYREWEECTLTHKVCISARGEFAEWCRRHAIGRSSVRISATGGTYYLFEDRNDALMFKLKFGGT